MPQFHDADIYINDSVYDRERGYGRVQQLTETLIEVNFGRTVVLYTYNGVQRGKTAVTLYWDVPYIVAPSKNAAHWVQTREKFEAIMRLVEITR